jgi:hypothetical protein
LGAALSGGGLLGLCPPRAFPCTPALPLLLSARFCEYLQGACPLRWLGSWLWLLFGLVGLWFVWVWCLAVGGSWRAGTLRTRASCLLRPKRGSFFLFAAISLNSFGAGSTALLHKCRVPVFLFCFGLRCLGGFSGLFCLSWLADTGPLDQVHLIRFSLSDAPSLVFFVLPPSGP